MAVKVILDVSITIKGPFCGHTAPGEIVVPGEHAYVIFKTDGSDEYTGFNVEWVVLRKFQSCLI